jgi:hypothetical protein
MDSDLNIRLSYSYKASCMWCNVMSILTLADVLCCLWFTCLALCVNLALQVGGVSDETVKYGFGFWATRTIEWLHCKLQTRPLVREGAPHRKFQTATSRQEIISGRKSHKGAQYQDILTDWLSVVKWLRLLYNLYINDTPQTIGVNLALFADDSCLYATERKESYVSRKV